MRHVPAIWGTLDPFVESGPVIGRKVANAGFLEALLRADPFDQYHFFLPDGQSAEELRTYLGQAFPGLERKIRLFPRTALPALLRDTVYHAFHLSDCLTSQGWLTALRNRLAGNVFPVTGVTHSLSYARYGQAFAQHVWAGVTARDCIVATSRAGQEAVRRILDICREHCGRRPVPEVARIPLGVWCSDFTEPPDQDMCEALGIRSSRTVFLVPGRISPYSKMDLLPLLRAFQRLQKGGTDLRDVCVVLAGGADESETLPDVLTNLAANIGLELLAVRHPDERAKKNLLARSNAVISLADNPQETFGLTLLEAAAAGKPVIASDYDGYRDLVVHGETGLLVPTLDRGAEDVSLMAPLLYDSAYTTCGWPRMWPCPWKNWPVICAGCFPRTFGKAWAGRRVRTRPASTGPESSANMWICGKGSRPLPHPNLGRVRTGIRWRWTTPACSRAIPRRVWTTPAFWNARNWAGPYTGAGTTRWCTRGWKVASIWS